MRARSICASRSATLPACWMTTTRICNTGWRRNLAFGVSYDYAQDEVDVRNQDPSGVLKLTFTGPELFVRVSY